MARKRGLDRAAVIGAAAELADREGIEAVTLARVASLLGVQSPSLYSHVDGLAGLRRAIALEAVRRLGAQLDDAARERSGVDALRAIARSYRDFAARHPGTYAMILTTPSPGDDPVGYAAFAAVVPTIADVLVELGASDADAVPLIRSLRSGLHGFVALETAGGFGLPDDIDRSFEILIDVLVEGVRARAIAPTQVVMGG
jgi:AcrR family transcriptional regulator